MKETRFFYIPEAESQIELPPEEALHATRVLRLKEGDEMMLMDGRGNFYKARLTGTSPRHCTYEVTESLAQRRQWAGHIHLAIAPTKTMERMEWMAEKCTEIGMDELSFVECRYSERRSIKLPRIEKIVVSAMKQSRKAWKPTVNDMCGFMQFVGAHTSGRRFIAHCYEDIPRTNLFDELSKGSAQDALVMIGPEGDFSPDEVAAAIKVGYTSVSLGSSRLRTETAGMSAVMMMQLCASLNNR